MGRIGEGDHPHLADRRQDEEAARAAERRRPATTTTSAPRRHRQYTINPAITHGVSRHIGRSRGQLADLVLWSPAFFGVKPDLVHQGRRDHRGADGRSQRLDPDAAAGALPPMFAAFGRALTATSVVAPPRPPCGPAWARSSASRKRSSPCRARARSPRRAMIHNGARRRSRSIPRPTRCGRTGAADLRARRGACRWRSDISCS